MFSGSGSPSRLNVPGAGGQNGMEMTGLGEKQLQQGPKLSADSMTGHLEKVQRAQNAAVAGRNLAPGKKTPFLFFLLHGSINLNFYRRSLTLARLNLDSILLPTL